MNVDRAEDGADGGDGLAVHSGAVAADGVVPAEPAIADGAKGKDFLGDRFIATYDGQASDADELVQRGPPAEEGFVADHAMPAEQSGIGHDNTAAEDAVVGDMDTAHDEAVVTDAGSALFTGLNRAMDGGGFADGDAVADGEFTDGWIGLEMLGGQAYVSSGPDRAGLTDAGAAVQVGVFMDDGCGTDRNVSLGEGVGSD